MEFLASFFDLTIYGSWFFYVTDDCYLQLPTYIFLFLVELVKTNVPIVTCPVLLEKIYIDHK